MPILPLARQANSICVVMLSLLVILESGNLKLYPRKEVCASFVLAAVKSAG